jgi:hypothetical protein
MWEAKHFVRLDPRRVLSVPENDTAVNDREGAEDKSGGSESVDSANPSTDLKNEDEDDDAAKEKEKKKKEKEKEKDTSRIDSWAAEVQRHIARQLNAQGYGWVEELKLRCAAIVEKARTMAEPNNRSHLQLAEQLAEILNSRRNRSEGSVILSTSENKEVEEGSVISSGENVALTDDSLVVVEKDGNGDVWTHTESEGERSIVVTTTVPVLNGPHIYTAEEILREGTSSLATGYGGKSSTATAAAGAEETGTAKGESHDGAVDAELGADEGSDGDKNNNKSEGGRGKSSKGGRVKKHDKSGDKRNRREGNRSGRGRERGGEGEGASNADDDLAAGGSGGDGDGSHSGDRVRDGRGDRGRGRGGGDRGRGRGRGKQQARSEVDGSADSSSDNASPSSTHPSKKQRQQANKPTSKSVDTSATTATTGSGGLGSEVEIEGGDVDKAAESEPVAPPALPLPPQSLYWRPSEVVLQLQSHQSQQSDALTHAPEAYRRVLRLLRQVHRTALTYHFMSSLSTLYPSFIPVITLRFAVLYRH